MKEQEKLKELQKSVANEYLNVVTIRQKRQVDIYGDTRTNFSPFFVGRGGVT